MTTEKTTTNREKNMLGKWPLEKCSAQSLVLGVVMDAPKTEAEICAATGSSPTNVRVLMQRLHRRGLVTSSRGMPRKWMAEPAAFF